MIPIPTFDVAIRVTTFVVPETFTLVVKMLGAVNALEAYKFPKT